MNEREKLILQRRAGSDVWEDATLDISNVVFENYSYHVCYRNGMDYFFKQNNLKVFRNPKKLDFCEVYYKNKICFHVEEVYCFDDKIAKIFFENGKTIWGFPGEIRLVKNTLTDNKQAGGVLGYYKEVVQAIAESEEDEFLINQFEGIQKVDDRSVLALYLKGKTGGGKAGPSRPLIFPFGINKSQSEALDMMFTSRMSIVQGPPGTGKTATILNFVANAVIDGLKVAVVSNNNAATDNVYEKLEGSAYSFIAAQLGKYDNVEQFFENYDPSIPAFPEHEVTWESVARERRSLLKLFAAENKKKKCIEKLAAIELEYKHFLEDHPDFNFQSLRFRSEKTNSEAVLKSLIKAKESKRGIGFFGRLYLRLKLRVGKGFFSINYEDLITCLNYFYYLSKMHELNEKIADCDKQTGGELINSKRKDFVELSKQLFEKELNDIFADKNREGFTSDNYKIKFEEFIENFPVVLSSTYSLAKCTDRGFLYDYLIIDESSQVNMASAILSMRVAKNIVVVGDEKQLPQIDDDAFEEKNLALLKKYDVPKQYSYHGNNILKSFQTLYGNKIESILLKEHYRCNPDIIGFCNERFYKGQLIIHTERKDTGYSMRLIRTQPGNHARSGPDGKSLYNQREIDEIAKLITEKDYKNVGVITPFRYQADTITKQLGDRVEVSDTIHKFQGREKDNIIFSAVVNDNSDFVNDENLINVAVSRAKESFVLIASDKVANSNYGVLSDLVNYIKYHTSFGKAEEGTVKSIFDLLYEDYKDQLRATLSNKANKDAISEILTANLLEEILSDDAYKMYRYKMHVSLRDFIRDSEIRLSGEERKFYRNPKSHADFLIVNRASKKPVLVIEVDGVAYHEKASKQLERDAKKDGLLRKAGIDLLRLKTNESDEEKRIREKLDSISSL